MLFVIVCLVTLNVTSWLACTTRVSVKSPARPYFSKGVSSDPRHVLVGLRVMLIAFFPCPDHSSGYHNRKNRHHAARRSGDFHPLRFSGSRGPRTYLSAERVTTFECWEHSIKWNNN